MSIIDSKSRTPVGIDWEKARINKGQGFFASVYDETLNIATPLILAFTTPSTTNKWIHSCIEAANRQSGKIEILEDPTITVDTGTDVTVYNRDRNETSNTSEVSTIETTPEANKMTRNPTITDAGTVLEYRPFGKDSTYTSEKIYCPILKANTTYAVRLTTGTDGGAGWIKISWVEYVHSVED